MLNKSYGSTFTLLAAAAVIAFIYFLFGTTGTAVVQGQNISKGRTCGSVEYTDALLKKDPSYKNVIDGINEYIKNYTATHKGDNNNVIVRIPVVVHVVYNTSLQNISEDQVKSQIDVMNADFRRHNSDTVNTPPPFKPLGADIQIEFGLARRDPNGNPTLGITRTYTTAQSFGLDDAVKFNSSGGHDAWDRNSYLNIWVCNLGSSLLGYATFPGGNPVTDGVVILTTAFGKTGYVSAPYNLGRTSTHEVGHWFSLYHIWGDDNGACWGSDNVGDTPNQGPENYGCPSFPVLDNCATTYPGAMSMNYMDYTDDGCMNIFTQGQSDRMLGALNGLRAPLLTSQGLQEVSGTPICSFTADSLSVMHGGTVHFADFSAGIPTGWNWTFTGGNIASSSQQNPAVTYNTPGVYTVKLRVTNSFGSDSLTKTSYIRVRGDVMNSFSILSPPSFTRITTNANDPSLVNFTWNRAGLTGGALNYKFKIKKLTTPLDYIYTANSSGTDSVITLRRSFLDSLAVTMGTTGDSVRCTWRATCYNGIDSLTSSNAFIVSFARGPIGIEQISSTIPQHFALFNNYPNPFNPVTKFKFDLPKNAQVKITVYDITGRVAEVITNQFMLAGSYSADWDASRFASGVYFYRIEAYGEFSDVKKMILIK